MRGNLAIKRRPADIEIGKELHCLFVRRRSDDDLGNKHSVTLCSPRKSVAAKTDSVASGAAAALSFNCGTSTVIKGIISNAGIPRNMLGNQRPAVVCFGLLSPFSSSCMHIFMFY